MLLAQPLNIAVMAHLHHPIASPFPGGLEMHTALLAEELSARGHMVTLFAKGGSRTSARLIPMLDAGFTFTRHPEGAAREAQTRLLDEAQRTTLELINEGNFDVVINNSLSALPHLTPPAQPMITILHTPPLPRVTAALDAQIHNRQAGHRVVSVSAANARQWRHHLRDIDVVHNGIRLAEWRVGPGVDRHPDIAVWAGRITPEKGLHVAIEAAALAGMRIQFAGPISDQDYFNRTIAPLLSESVEHVGHLNHTQLAAFLGSGTVFIASPLWAEPFGLTTVEAMACGTPVAALPCGAMDEIIDARGGVVAAGFSAADLARAVEQSRTLNTSQVRASAERFSVEAMITRYEQHLGELVGHGVLANTDMMAS
ncbi:glycosyltransferase [Arthrobacter sp. CAN_C5]|uniref:glycosyltransferase n=1 Tax=Arthrobacter sp. CAN_C5 TaxID=2760706 RepID=UPI001AE27643|nr:glycosyltransferase [Arthrobacter sp. CAN_C5]MBP2218518.1 glycosyltransferase involved in cell wall biosynthesis [Arthrobacter sp. CAN_C5]